MDRVGVSLNTEDAVKYLRDWRRRTLALALGAMESASPHDTGNHDQTRRNPGPQHRNDFEFLLQVRNSVDDKQTTRF